MRRFELVTGATRKFFEITLHGTDVEVRSGRMGTLGRSQTKTYADAATARAERDELIYEKLQEARRWGVADMASQQGQADDAAVSLSLRRERRASTTSHGRVC